jgi:hypothetical protein
LTLLRLLRSAVSSQFDCVDWFHRVRLCRFDGNQSNSIRRHNEQSTPIPSKSPRSRIHSTRCSLLLLQPANVARKSWRLHSPIQSQRLSRKKTSMHCRAFACLERWGRQRSAEHCRCLSLLQPVAPQATQRDGPAGIQSACAKAAMCPALARDNLD